MNQNKARQGGKGRGNNFGGKPGSAKQKPGCNQGNSGTAKNRSGTPHNRAQNRSGTSDNQQGKKQPQSQPNNKGNQQPNLGRGKPRFQHQEGNSQCGKRGEASQHCQQQTKNEDKNNSGRYPAPNQGGKHNKSNVCPLGSQGQNESGIQIRIKQINQQHGKGCKPPDWILHNDKRASQPNIIGSNRQSGPNNHQGMNKNNNQNQGQKLILSNMKGCTFVDEKGKTNQFILQQKAREMPINKMQANLHQQNVCKENQNSSGNHPPRMVGQRGGRGRGRGNLCPITIGQLGGRGNPGPIAISQPGGRGNPGPITIGQQRGRGRGRGNPGLIMIGHRGGRRQGRGRSPCGGRPLPIRNPKELASDATTGHSRQVSLQNPGYCASNKQQNNRTTLKPEHNFPQQIKRMMNENYLKNRERIEGLKKIKQMKEAIMATIPGFQSHHNEAQAELEEQPSRKPRNTQCLKQNFQDRSRNTASAPKSQQYQQEDRPDNVNWASTVQPRNMNYHQRRRLSRKAHTAGSRPPESLQTEQIWNQTFNRPTIQSQISSQISQERNNDNVVIFDRETTNTKNLSIGFKTNQDTAVLVKDMKGNSTTNESVSLETPENNKMNPDHLENLDCTIEQDLINFDNTCEQDYGADTYDKNPTNFTETYEDNQEAWEGTYEENPDEGTYEENQEDLQGTYEENQEKWEGTYVENQEELEGSYEESQDEGNFEDNQEELDGTYEENQEELEGTYEENQEVWEGPYEENQEEWEGPYEENQEEWEGAYGENQDEGNFEDNQEELDGTYEENQEVWEGTYEENQEEWEGPYEENQKEWEGAYGENQEIWEGPYEKSQEEWEGTYEDNQEGREGTYEENQEEFEGSFVENQDQLDEMCTYTKEQLGETYEENTNCLEIDKEPKHAAYNENQVFTNDKCEESQDKLMEKYEESQKNTDLIWEDIEGKSEENTLNLMQTLNASLPKTQVMMSAIGEISQNVEKGDNLDVKIPDQNALTGDNKSFLETNKIEHIEEIGMDNLQSAEQNTDNQKTEEPYDPLEEALSANIDSKKETVNFFCNEKFEHVGLHIKPCQENTEESENFNLRSDQNTQKNGSEMTKSRKNRFVATDNIICGVVGKDDIDFLKADPEDDVKEKEKLLMNNWKKDKNEDEIKNIHVEKQLSTLPDGEKVKIQNWTMVSDTCVSHSNIKEIESQLKEKYHESRERSAKHFNSESKLSIKIENVDDDEFLNIKEKENILMEKWKQGQEIEHLYSDPEGKVNRNVIDSDSSLKENTVVCKNFQETQESVLQDESEKTYICSLLTKENCQDSTCTNHHLTKGIPYLWQIKILGKWMCAPMIENEKIENGFCDLKDSVSMEIMFNEQMFCFHINFKDPMKGSIFGTNQKPVGDDQQYEVRRLSTMSFAEPTENTESCVSQWRWYYEDDDKKWQLFGKDSLIYTLEKKYLTHQKTYMFTKESLSTMYRVDFRRMEQVMVDTDKVFKLIRRPLFISKSDVEQQKYAKIIPIPLAMRTPRPEHFHMWDCAHDFELVELDTAGVEYNNVLKSFHYSMNEESFHIKHVYRIQNRKLWIEYDAKKTMMHTDIEQDSGSINLNEKDLFHGTDSVNSCRGICTNNFDFRTSGRNATLYGEGSYFAKNAKLSHYYTEPDPDTGLRAMFRAKVLVGQFTVGNPSLRRPPELPGHSHKLYDSCVDKIDDPQIFVVFDRNQCYPEYLYFYEEREIILQPLSYPDTPLVYPYPQSTSIHGDSSQSEHDKNQCSVQ